MSKAFFMVRAAVDAPLREKFDQWYSSHHMPMALADFEAEKAWRFWSTVDPNVHYALYEFADEAKLRAAMKDEILKPLIADFDQAWPSGVTRTRDLLTMVDERSGQGRPAVPPKAYLVVRAVVEEPLRQKFDRWYASDHLPTDVAVFKAEMAWRFWSVADAGVHYAVYQFADLNRLHAARNSDAVPSLRKAFDDAWPHGVTRAPDILSLVEEQSGQR
jgi:hypothetical protein